MLFRSLAGLLLALVPGCGGSPPAAGSGRPTRVPKVTTASVESRTLSYVTRAIGSLDAYDWVTIPARVEGTIESLALEPGDAVTPEKVLAGLCDLAAATAVGQVGAATPGGRG